MTGQMTEGQSYFYKPSLMGAPWSFQLMGDALAWQAGRRQGRLAYADIKRVRLSYRPATLQSYRFMTEIWSDKQPKLTIVSTTWKSLTDQERLDDAYSSFIEELHNRIGRSGGTVAFQGGTAPYIYWPGLVLFVGAALGMAGLTVRGLQIEQWMGAAFIAAFFAIFVWHIGGFFRRNRPITYSPDSLPPELVPARRIQAR